MRIIAGLYKGHKLFTPSGLSIRPTSDRVRETLFSVLGSRVADAHFLDLFAGIGAVGIEALSRGARYVVFNDQSPKAVQTVQRNLLKVDGQAHVYRFSAVVFLSKMQELGPFDLVFCDPPYRFDRGQDVLEKIVQGGFLKRDGWIIYENSTRTATPAAPETLVRVREQSLGETRLSYFQLTGG